MHPDDAVALRDKLATALSASQDWAPGFRRDKKQFKKLLESETRLQRKLRQYLKELSRSRVTEWVNWVKYHAEVTPGLSAAKPKVSVIVDISDDQTSTEINLVTKVVFEEIASAAAAGALAQISDSRIPVANLSTLVDNVARTRAADLATQMTQTTIDKVRSSIETSLKLGEDTNAAKDRLSAFIDDESKAEQVARTESANAWRRGVLETGRQTGATSKTWHVEGDPCQICEPMDGQTVALDEDFIGGDGESYSGEDGAHVNCRCDQSINYAPIDEQ